MAQEGVGLASPENHQGPKHIAAKSCDQITRPRPGNGIQTQPVFGSSCTDACEPATITMSPRLAIRWLQSTTTFVRAIDDMMPSSMPSSMPVNAIEGQFFTSLFKMPNKETFQNIAAADVWLSHFKVSPLIGFNWQETYWHGAPSSRGCQEIVNTFLPSPLGQNMHLRRVTVHDTCGPALPTTVPKCSIKHATDKVPKASSRAMLQRASQMRANPCLVKMISFVKLFQAFNKLFSLPK